jgi:hypothetical protein
MALKIPGIPLHLFQRLCVPGHFEPLLKVKKKGGNFLKRKQNKKKNPRAQNNVIDE